MLVIKESFKPKNKEQKLKFETEKYVIENIKNLNTLLSELKNHPCCFEYKWDTDGRLIIIFPEGYFYGIAQGIRINEKTKNGCIKLALIKLEEVWEMNCL